MFQSLRTNQPFYVLTKLPSPRLDIGTVSTVSAPQMKFLAMPQGLGTQPEYVVDVTVLINGATLLYQRLPSNKEIADFGEGYGNIVVATSRDAMNNEVVTLKNKSEEHIKRVPDEELKIVAYESILQQLNPEYAENQKREAEINTLKNQTNMMSQTINNLELMVSLLLSEIKGKKSETSNKDNHK